MVILQEHHRFFRSFPGKRPVRITARSLRELPDIRVRHVEQPALELYAKDAGGRAADCRRRDYPLLRFTCERPEASYAAATFGGRREDYDVVKTGGSHGMSVDATDGTMDAWRRLVSEQPVLAARRASLAASVNRRYAPFDTALAEGDEVVFIPPVSGG